MLLPCTGVQTNGPRYDEVLRFICTCLPDSSYDMLIMRIREVCL